MVGKDEGPVIQEMKHRENFTIIIDYSSQKQEKKFNLFLIIAALCEVC